MINCLLGYHTYVITIDYPYVEESKPCSLQRLYSTVCTNIAALRSLKQPVEHWDAWLITIITSRLDKNTAHSWQLHQRNTELPKYVELESFLTNRCVVIENSESTWQRGSVVKYENLERISSSKKSSVTTSKKSLLAASKKPTQSCACCQECHKFYECEKFKALSVTARLGLAREARLCFNCLSPFH